MGNTVALWTDSPGKLGGLGGETPSGPADLFMQAPPT